MFYLLTVNPMLLRSSDYSLLTGDGQRKYLNQKERICFYSALEDEEFKIKVFCEMMFWTGARISEVLNLKPSNIDLSEQIVNIECLKKRKNGIFRQIPLPPLVINNLVELLEDISDNQRIWSFTRRSGYRYVIRIMNKANIYGPMACPKGLRHSFAIHCLNKEVPVTLIKKWLGHSSLVTTMIYVNLISAEEKKFARKLWRE